MKFLLTLQRQFLSIAAAVKWLTLKLHGSSRLVTQHPSPAVTNCWKEETRCQAAAFSHEGERRAKVTQAKHEAKKQ